MLCSHIYMHTYIKLIGFIAKLALMYVMWRLLYPFIIIYSKHTFSLQTKLSYSNLELWA